MTDVSESIRALEPWYHSIDLGGGVVTPGKGDPKAKFDRLAKHLPRKLKRLRVLDIGCNAGGISVEFAKRGAQVIGIEAGAGYHRQAMWVRDYLRLDNFVPLQRSVYEIGDLGTFDVVVFLGVVYHLRHPQLALDLLAGLTAGWMFLSTPTIASDAAVMECRLPVDLGAPVTAAQEPAYNWWYPSEAALRRMLTAAGFTDVQVTGGSSRPFVSSKAGVDNRSDFPTGQIEMKARGRGTGTLLHLPLQRQSA